MRNRDCVYWKETDCVEPGTTNTGGCFRNLVSTGGLRVSYFDGEENLFRVGYYHLRLRKVLDRREEAVHGSLREAMPINPPAIPGVTANIHIP